MWVQGAHLIPGQLCSHARLEGRAGGNKRQKRCAGFPSRVSKLLCENDCSHSAWICFWEYTNLSLLEVSEVSRSLSWGLCVLP